MSNKKKSDHLKYSFENFTAIVEGYKKIDQRGKFTSLLKAVTLCTECNESYREKRDELPVNCLVRQLPLDRIDNGKKIENYFMRVRRDHGFLRNLFEKNLKTKTVVDRLVSAKFSIGLNPWLDRCMLFRKSSRTKLMIVGIDYKHFPCFYINNDDHQFPLSSYENENNIWGPTWKRFWSNLLGEPYEDNKVNAFIKKQGVFITNSMLCFGGSENPQSHYYGYLVRCRRFIKEMIRIVKPEILVSFGKFGCRNVASILKEENEGDEFLNRLAKSSSSLKEMTSIARKKRCRNGIRVNYNSRDIAFWPLYQPARSHIYSYKGDYEVLRKLCHV